MIHIERPELLRRRERTRKALVGLLFCLIPVFWPAQAFCQPLETFLEPAQLVDISSPYRDRIVRILVRENDKVSKGTLLAELESDILKNRLRLARQSARFHGEIDAAKALVQLRRNRVRLLEHLEQSGNARPQELATARAELAMAKAELLGAQERQQLRKLEVAIIEAQIREKQLVSPLDGVIIQINRQEAELLGGNDPQPLLTIAQLDPLHAVFHLPPEATAELETERNVPLQIDGRTVIATVDFVSPIIDAQSGTVTVRLIVPNGDQSLRSGSRCLLALENISGESAHDRQENTPGQDTLR